MTVLAEKVKNRIWVTAGYPIAGLHSSVPGARFSKTDGPHWSCPLTMESCYLLREKFGSELKVGKELGVWAREQLAKEASLTALATMERCELPQLQTRAPSLYGAVQGRPYQTIAARFVTEGRHVLLADTPGLGKTLEVLAGIEESGVPGPYLIIAPKTACEVVWAREIRKWVPRAHVMTLPEGRARRDNVLDMLQPMSEEYVGLKNVFVIAHPNAVMTKAWWKCKECGTLTKIKAYKELDCEHDSKQAPRIVEHTFPQLFAIEWGAIVADEAEQCLLRRSGLPTQTRYGMEMLRDCMRKDGLRIAVSGTPFRGRPHLLWGTLNWLRSDEFPAFLAWAETHYTIDTGYGGSKKIGGLKREDLLYKTLNRIMLRRTKSEVAPELPPKLYIGDNLTPGDPQSPVGVWLPMDPKQAKAYQEMQQVSVAAVENGELEAIGVLAELTRLQQFASGYGRMVSDGGAPSEYGQFIRDEFVPQLPSNKFDWLQQRLHEAGYPDDPQYKIVIVSRFTSLLNLFAKELKVPHVMITGAVSGQKRDRAVDTFNDPNWHGVCFLNTKAGGVAITLDGADEMIFLDRTHIPDDQEQAEERINNRRPEEKVLQRRYVYLGSQGTVDEAIAWTNHEREHDSKTILDSRRGVTDWATKAIKGE